MFHYSRTLSQMLNCRVRRVEKGLYVVHSGLCGKSGPLRRPESRDKEYQRSTDGLLALFLLSLMFLTESLVCNYTESLEIQEDKLFSLLR